jgi:hypothetical protein
MAEDWNRKSDLKSCAISRTCIYGLILLTCEELVSPPPSFLSKGERERETYKSLEWELANKKLSRLLVASDFSESYSTRLISVRLLDTSSRWGALAGGLGG